MNKTLKTVLLCTSIITGTLLCQLLNHADQGEKTINAHSSVQRNTQEHTLDKQYRDRLRAIKQEITTLKDAIMLVDSDVHAPKLQKIEAQFKALNEELERKKLLDQMSTIFLQQQAAVEREIFDTKKLLGNKSRADIE